MFFTLIALARLPVLLEIEITAIELSVDHEDPSLWLSISTHGN